MEKQSRYLVIADDFTGSNDTGVQIRRRGLEVGVVFSSSGIKEDDNSYVVDTESRALPPEKAYSTVMKYLEGINFPAFKHVLKKVDSTLRGSIGAEIAAVKAAMKPDIIVFAPALPSLGRTTENMIHKLSGVPITQTEMAQDPKTPVTQDNINQILADALKETVRHFTAKQIEDGQISFEGCNAFSADVASNRHLEMLAKAALAADKRILWVGSSAIADVLLGLESGVNSALAVVASLSSVSREQLLYAQGQGASLVTVPVGDIILGIKTPGDIAGEAIGLLEKGSDVILASAASVDRESGFKNADEAAAQKGMPASEVSLYTQNLMGEISKLIVSKYVPAGVFLTGGDTAIAFMRSLGATGSLIETEIEIGIPMMRLHGGEYEGMKIVTKAGAFGKKEAISFALRKLKEV